MFQFTRAKDIVLRATYEHLVFKAEYEFFDPIDIHNLSDIQISPGYLRRILNVLAKEGLVDQDQYDSDAPVYFTVSERGLEEAEKLPSLASLLEDAKNTNQSQAAIPTADGFVTLDHNQSAYADIAEAIDLAIEEAKNTKPNDVSGDQHHSLVSRLKAARELWNAFELQKIQIEVGILMAIEDAQNALKRNFKLIKGPLLVEAIKAFVIASVNGIHL